MFKKPFCVKGLGNEISAEDNLNFPLLWELGIEDNLELHVIEWHSKFDALLGSEDLKKLGAQIDYKTNTLKIGSKTIPFVFQYVSPIIKPYKVTALNYLKIPVSVENGDVYFPETQLTTELTIPDSIVTAHNGKCLFPVDQRIEINFKERFQVTPLCEVNICKPPVNKEKAKISEKLRTTHLNSEEKLAIVNICKKFSDVFYDEKSDLSFSNAVKHQIRTVDETPVYVKPFRHPHSMKEEIQKQVQKLLDNKVIRPSISPYSSPVWIVPKKVDASGQKKFRMVIDFRKLNEKTVEDKYPIPRIDEILDNLGKCSYFTTLDLAQGFHQIEMDPKSIEKTAFTVNNGHFEYVRMPFGLKNAPSTFQRVMDNIFREHLHKFLFVYMDDIVIFSKSLDEHIQHLTKVFRKLKEYNLKIQIDKSEFCRKDVEFLGHVITPFGIKPNPSKLVAIDRFPLPRTQKEIKSFLGLVGYYRRFISNFAKVVSPLTKCLKKGATIDTKNMDYVSAFHQCKEILMNAPVLAYPDFTKTFKLTTDASNVAIGSVLSQSNRPIAFYSRTLNSAERNYSTIEKELLSILNSVKHFRPYLFGQRFIIETDHQPLVWLYKLKEPNSRLIRWKLKLEEFDFEIQYKKGKENVVADALSRVEINNNEDRNDADNESTVPNVDTVPDPMDIELDDILSSGDLVNDPSYQNALSELRDYVSRQVDNQPSSSENESVVETIHSTNDDGGKAIPISERCINVFHNRIFFKLGDTSKHKCIRPFNRNTHLVTLKRSSIRESLSDIIKEIFRPDLCYGVYFHHDDIRLPFIDLFKSLFNTSVKVFICNTFCKDVVDPEIQKTVISEYHDENHNGINETLNQLKNKFFWPNMKETITKIINNCDVCLQSKYERHPYNLKFSGPLLAKRPFEVVHMDTFSFQNSKFLTIIDLFSKYAQAYLIKDGTSLTILNKLRHYFSHHNVPKKIVCDQGREFSNKTFSEFCKLHKIELHYTTVNNPSSNSPIERFHSTLLEKLRILRIKNPGDLPSNIVISAILIYNQSIHSATGYSPFHLLYGPYDELIEFDIDMTLYETYNEKRRQEILPFYEHIYNKNKRKAEKNLEKQNKDKEDTPNLENLDVYIERERPRKVDPPFEKINVLNQEENKITGLTQKSRETTANIKKVKRLRKGMSCSQDDPGSPEPGPSGVTN